MHNLAFLQLEANNLLDAEANFTEALANLRQLAINNPDIYLLYVVTAIINIAEIQYKTFRYEESEKNYTEAFDIYVDLIRKLPGIHSDRVTSEFCKLIEIKEKLSKTGEAEELKVKLNELMSTTDTDNKQ